MCVVKLISFDKLLKMYPDHVFSNDGALWSSNECGAVEISPEEFCFFGGKEIKLESVFPDLITTDGYHILEEFVEEWIVKPTEIKKINNNS